MRLTIHFDCEVNTVFRDRLPVTHQSVTIGEIEMEAPWLKTNIQLIKPN